MLGYPRGEYPPQHLPANVVPDDGLLMSTGSAALVVTGEWERCKDQQLGRVLKPIACPGRVNPAASHPPMLLALAK